MSSCEIKPPPTPCSIHVPLLEHETADFEFATWPQAVQNIHTRELNAWAKRNPELDIVEQNHSLDAGRRVTVTEFRHAARPAP